jgi:dTDP-4-dehydrorhamnose 3,5-epimerase
MIFESLPLAGAWLLSGEPAADARGDFVRVFCEAEFACHGLQLHFPQHSVSHNPRSGTLRGLHYQSGDYAETKLVRCVRGSIFDVIVDIRPGSSTYGRWHAEKLSADNGLALYIPTGFAHGFLTLEDHSDVLYQITPAHQSGHGRALRWDDPDLGIKWPLQPQLLSDADSKAPFFATL